MFTLPNGPTDFCLGLSPTHQDSPKWLTTSTSFPAWYYSTKSLYCNYGLVEETGRCPLRQDMAHLLNTPSNKHGYMDKPMFAIRMVFSGVMSSTLAHELFQANWNLFLTCSPYMHRSLTPRQFSAGGSRRPPARCSAFWGWRPPKMPSAKRPCRPDFSAPVRDDHGGRDVLRLYRVATRVIKHLVNGILAHRAMGTEVLEVVRIWVKLLELDVSWCFSWSGFAEPQKMARDFLHQTGHLPILSHFRSFSRC